ncbi:hypothetical protein LTR10_019795 [Elasticomyces elasticus]|uniref:Vacuolar ATPase assembly protein VMA22 n=1 Tax=Exophiala sideris TaxID=1016849 RepID=A0ABR0JCJ4_9EURO|nr:hypothetical protein LTR10_019795 [Elasticomyces elasticus]KAK5032076.1 hypothetical protein LTS07_004698 [Exophiala sideris]KAK5041004.1 hypothetical protein LTR13_003306 [Exophiala sideris]KAK5061662.1 hypothetical protein LTR69_004844 [Exophiala sideris]KAK5184362.1 hypothetical protein LTR44_003035 [Eurotiomycetes sp. CCFEE 6388]
MAAQLPSPPSTPQPEDKSNSGLAQEDVEDESSLSERLDQLLESYLNLLDTYISLREQLSKDLSTGFFSLASANRNSTLGPGRRYGEEGYDQRMKALRTVQIDQTTQTPPSSRAETEERGDSKEATEECEDSAQEDTHSVTETSTEGYTGETPVDRETEDKDNPPQSKHHKNTDTENDTHTKASSNPTHSTSHLPPCYNYNIHTSTPPTPTKDPLKWYGILVPPPLRQCQTHFQHAVSSTTPDLLSTTSEMRSLEEQIWELRRALDPTEGYEGQDHVAKASTDELGENGKEDNDLSLSSSSLSKDESNSRKQLPTRKASLLSPSSPARPAEPRSRILKLG